MIEVLTVAFVGALVSLDRTAFLQIMISQPLIAGTIVGFVLGDVVSGLAIGSVLELLWVGDVPAGSSVPPNETAAAIIATSVNIIAGRELGLSGTNSMPFMVLSMLLSIPLAVVGQRIDIGARRFNRRYCVNADRLLASGEIDRIGLENLKGLLTFLVSSFVSLLLLTGSGVLLAVSTYRFVPENFMNGLTLSFYLLIGLGIAVSIRTANKQKILPLFSAGLLFGIAISWMRE